MNQSDNIALVIFNCTKYWNELSSAVNSVKVVIPNQENILIIPSIVKKFKYLKEFLPAVNVFKPLRANQS